MNDFALTWDDLRNRARNHNDLSTEQKNDAVVAFDFLQSNFSDSFFQIKHPLFAVKPMPSHIEERFLNSFTNLCGKN
jgi:hypothetical protein